MTTEEMRSMIELIISMENRSLCKHEIGCKFFESRPLCKEGEGTYFIDAIQKALGAKDLMVLSEILSKAKKP